MFENTILEQPKDTDYLWRFIKPQYIESLLRGEIYFSQLSDFDDYLENISPLLYLLQLMSNRNGEVDLIKYSEGNKFEKLIANMEFACFDIAARQVYEVDKSTSYSESMIKDIHDFDNLHKEHLANQNSILTSCWFIGDLNESATMWNNYSCEDGIAIRIRFDKFKKIFSLLFESELIQKKLIVTGKVKYADFTDFKSWKELIRSGIPMSHIKHKSFQQENEFRMTIRVNSDSNTINKCQLVFDRIFYNDCITFVLHPSASYSDIEKFRSRFIFPYSQVISFSKLWFRKKK